MVDKFFLCHCVVICDTIDELKDSILTRRRPLRNLALVLSGFVITVLAFSCTPSPSQLKKAVEENPDIVFAAIEKDPQKFIEVVNKAAREAQMKGREKEMQEERDRMEAEFKNPKKPEIGDSRVIFGAKDAPVTIVEYSDFQCPYCQRGYNTMKEVLKAYEGKVRVIYKHLPLDFHPMAEPAARYFEAIGLQSPSKAEKFHDAVFEDQQSLGAEKGDFLDKMAKKVGADMGKLKKDLESEAVKGIIAADMAEARKFEFSGTPGFLVNGVSLKGAYPLDEFKKIIDRHLGESK
ncbi:MAG: thioredoxin domain-containing protein [Bdellovibrionaceae bacterium]|nr:thioredoxin domain-containing protein [Bdellovibrionales bacterium]MCB9086376.1 thioredoxin domain-containing protein [Pseudobdellovibrionaceae bacterium]